MDNINTIYIFSKGRPECITANTLNRIDYTGEWFICCQEDDETLNEYIENWGKEKVLTYDYYKYLPDGYTIKIRRVDTGEYETLTVFNDSQKNKEY